MEQGGAREIRPCLKENTWVKRDAGKAPAAVRVQRHQAFGVIFVAGDDETGLGAQPEVPEHVTRCHRGDEKVFGIVAGRITPERRVR